MILKKLWCFLRELYGESNNINIYDVIQELFRKKQNGQPMDGEFNSLAKEFW